MITKPIIMKKAIFCIVVLFLCSITSHAQLSVAKMIGKDADKFGIGYGMFTYFDIPLRNENQSVRLELVDFTIFPTKGENLFTSTKEMKGYLSIKLGYKYVFSETRTGFYLLPSFGYVKTMLSNEGEELTDSDGIAGALEGGYALEVGQNGHSINLGLKYEYDRGDATHTIQSIGLRFSYAFGLFGRRE